MRFIKPLFAMKQRSDATPFHVSKLAIAMQRQEHFGILSRLSRTAIVTYDPKSWAAGVWTIRKKLEVSGLQAFLALIDWRSQVKWRRDR